MFANNHFKLNVLSCSIVRDTEVNYSIMQKQLYLKQWFKKNSKHLFDFVKIEQSVGGILFCATAVLMLESVELTLPVVKGRSGT